MKADKAEVINALKKAHTAFLNKDYKSSLKEYQWLERNLQDKPEDLPVIWIELGWNFYFLQDFENAIFYLQKAVREPQLNLKQRFDCLRLLGYSHEYAGREEKGLAYLQDALAEELSDFDKRHILFEIGKIFFSQNNPIEAKKYLQQAYGIFSNDELDYIQTARYYLGFIAYIEGKQEDAERLFHEIIKFARDEPGQAPGHFGLAHLSYEQKEYEAVIEICQKIIQLDNQFYDKETLAFFLCRAYMELEMWTELGLFLPHLIDEFPEGKYRSAYSTFLAAAHTRQIPDFPKTDLKSLN